MRMVESRECVAMLLAGGQGSRLGVLTRGRAKPAVPYGGKYRIIDFPLSNCANSGIDVVGVLTQYEPFILNSYIGTGSAWDLDTNAGGVFVLSPYTQAGDVGRWYAGTADAIYQNCKFIEQYSPRYVVVLSGDHIYKMDYGAMVRFHRERGADATIAVMRVPLEQASRFGIMETDGDRRVTAFTEKPAHPTSDLASMGIYVFTWEKVSAYLSADAADPASAHDFGKNVIPAMLGAGERMFAYPFEGYWRDVGTVESLWQANMDLLGDDPQINLADESWKIYSRNPSRPAAHVGRGARLDTCMVSEGCDLAGAVEHSVLFQDVRVGAGAVVRDSVLMRGCAIGEGAVVERAVVDEGVRVGAGARVGGPGPLTVVGQGAAVAAGATVEAGSSVEPDAEVGTAGAAARGAREG